MADRSDATAVTEEDVRELMRGNYGRASLEQLARFAVPFFFVLQGRLSPPDHSHNRKLLKNGTAFFLHFGEHPYGVTANHVIERALQGDVVKRGLFPLEYSGPAKAKTLLELPDLRARIIARDAVRDIATFAISADELDLLRASVLSGTPSVPTVGTGGIGFAGYPGVRREIVDMRHVPDGPELTLVMEPFVGIGIAKSIESDGRIKYQFERAFTVQTPGFVLPPPGFDLGGMSGGPLLMKQETRSGLERWAPAGVITDGRIFEHSHDGQLIASLADCLQPDGSISTRRA